MSATELDRFKPLAGVSILVSVHHAQMQFKEYLLFTHRGLSGPAILQISSYWQPGTSIKINFLPEQAIADVVKTARQQSPQQKLKTVLAAYLPKRFLETFLPPTLLDKAMANLSKIDLGFLEQLLHAWCFTPSGTEGYKTAEVTVGGVDCNALSSKTMMVQSVPGLYYIGEAVDVTGWLGGYNFQWAWASGWAAAQYV